MCFFTDKQFYKSSSRVYVWERKKGYAISSGRIDRYMLECNEFEVDASSKGQPTIFNARESRMRLDELWPDLDGILFFSRSLIFSFHSRRAFCYSLEYSSALLQRCTALSRLSIAVPSILKWDLVTPTGHPPAMVAGSEIEPFLTARAIPTSLNNGKVNYKTEKTTCKKITRSDRGSTARGYRFYFITKVYLWPTGN